MNFKKLSFSEGLKKSFRNRIVSGQFQDYPEDSRKVNQTATGFGKRDKT